MSKVHINTFECENKDSKSELIFTPLSKFFFHIANYATTYADIY